MRHTFILFFLAAMLLPAVNCPAADKEHGTVIREAAMYVSPDTRSQRLGTATRGRDTFMMERSTIDGKPWAHVLIVTETSLDTENPVGKEVSGWVDGRLVITTSTPNGDQIIFGEAADSERQAEQRGGRKNAAQDAMRLYYRMYEYFPNSPLSGEAFWRAADIRWQLEKAGVLSRPSAHEMSPDAREQIDEDTMHELIKKFPHSKWSDLAAYDLIDNKVCGDWKGEAKCPEKESDLYEHYAHEHPESPKAAEALYNAAWRQAALVDIYKGDRQQGKSEKAQRKALELTQELTGKFPQSDWKPRAETLIYALQQGIPTYGSGNVGGPDDMKR
ncbi:MAG: tetratricopeptide repeat protein [Candidatus Angelobacter sp.]